MPSSGYGIKALVTRDNHPEHARQVGALLDAVKLAMKHGMFIEWLESFVAAHEAGADIYDAAAAGLIEWDM